MHSSCQAFIKVMTSDGINPVFSSNTKNEAKGDLAHFTSIMQITCTWPFPLYRLMSSVCHIFISASGGHNGS